jgi:hypothetical protein
LLEVPIDEKRAVLAPLRARRRRIDAISGLFKNYNARFDDELPG